MDEPSGQGAVVEVAAVNLHEEAVDHLVRPEAAHPVGHLEGAVGQVLVYPAGGDNAQLEIIRLREKRLSPVTETLSGCL